MRKVPFQCVYSRSAWATGSDPLEREVVYAETGPITVGYRSGPICNALTRDGSVKGEYRQLIWLWAARPARLVGAGNSLMPAGRQVSPSGLQRVRSEGVEPSFCRFDEHLADRFARTAVLDKHGDFVQCQRHECIPFFWRKRHPPHLGVAGKRLSAGTHRKRPAGTLFIETAENGAHDVRRRE